MFRRRGIDDESSVGVGLSAGALAMLPQNGSFAIGSPLDTPTPREKLVGLILKCPEQPP